MRREIILKFTSALIGLSVFTMLLTPVLAAPCPNINTRWGYASDAGGPLPDGELITGWIDGVQYGATATIDGTGLFIIDTLGDSDYGLGTEKSGGVFGDFIYYVHGDLTSASGGVFMTGVSVPEPWVYGGFEAFPEDLAEDPFTPELLKISKISVAPIPYIGIYDASGAANITDYALDINNGGPVRIAAGDILDTVGLITYIDPASFGGISNDDALTLTEYWTGYAVDRVEFGIINVYPQETVMNNAPNPPAGKEIHRTPTDGSDTNNCSSDFAVGPKVILPPHWDYEALGPVGSSASLDSFGISYNLDCGHLGTPDIYYSVDFNSTWNFIDQDPDRDGIYSWTAPGPGTYWWIVNGDEGFGPGYIWPLPGAPAEAGPYEITVSDYTISLSEGWNLVSQPLIQSDEDIGVVLNDISGKWDCIQIYDASSPYPWRSNSTFKPDQLNDLKTLNHKIGFWINITEENVNLAVEGFIPSYTEIPLFAGWNLVGYPSMSTEIVADALWGTGADKIEVFDPAEPYRIREVGPTYVMRPGEGYWVHVPADTIWIIDW